MIIIPLLAHSRRAGGVGNQAPEILDVLLPHYDLACPGGYSANAEVDTLIFVYKKLTV